MDGVTAKLLIFTIEYLAAIRAHISGEDSPMGEALYSPGAAEAH
ncbi:hypothetical protein KCMC57_up10840 [Kitasatospora sp. CMC57]|uniref:Uncharacterized protein n=1 Tax=Kitasatospora sp. CMC57 TaxID=3231513 RepID=A0AB33JWI0_9ACTN